MNKSTQNEERVLTFYHGGVEKNFDINQIDLLKSSEKQQNNNKSYAGFYMYGEDNKQMAIYYAKQENIKKYTESKGIIKIIMNKDVKIYEVEPFKITRITKEQIQKLQEQGYDLISGRMLGKIEYVLLRKDKIIDIQFEELQMKSESVAMSKDTQIEENER